MKVWEGLAKLDQVEQAVKAKNYRQTAIFCEAIKQAVAAIPAGNGKSVTITQAKLPDYDSLLESLKGVRL